MAVQQQSRQRAIRWAIVLGVVAVVVYVGFIYLVGLRGGG